MTKPEVPRADPTGHARMIYKGEAWEYGSHEIMWSRYWHDLAVWGEQEIERLTRERDEARRDCLNFKLYGNIAGAAVEPSEQPHEYGEKS